METKNYIIRESVFADYEYFFKWETDERVTEFLSYDGDRSYEDVVSEAFAHKYDDSTIDYTIVDKSTMKPIGKVCISRIDRNVDSLDITKIYIGDAENRNRGVGREVITELLSYFFLFMHMERVTLDYYDGNERAQALYESIGFQHEGVARNACKKNGKYKNLNLMSMLRSEYFEKYGK